MGVEQGLLALIGAADDATYEIEQSLRFDGGAQLAKTFGATGNGRVWSLSVWLKRAGGIGDNDRDIFGAYTGSYPRIGLVECGAGPSADHFGIDQGGPSGNGTYYANGKRRDPSAWYHLVVSVDYNSPSAKIWVNGVLEGAAQNSLAADGGLINSAGVPHHIGSRVTVPSGNNRWLGYMAEFHFLDTDSQLSDPYDFGEFDSNGVWRPIEYTGSYGDNGFYMKFDPTAANGIGHDHSGNGNNFTASGFTTSGTGTDVMSDTPTNNYCTLDPINVNNNTSASAPSNGNLDLTADTGRFGTIAVTSGKWYWEVTLTGTNSEYNYYFGAQNVQKGTVEARMMCNGGNTPDGNNISGSSNGTRTQPTGSRPSLPATIGVKLDMDNGDIEFVQGGVVNGKVTGITNWNGAVAPYISANTGTFTYKTATFNFGQRAFSNTIPTGYSALNTANLPAPTIKDGSDYLNTVLWTGNATDDRAITGVGFQPSWTWIKTRSASDNHVLNDEVRGANKQLFSNLTEQELSGTTLLKSFDSDGFTLGTDSAVNGSSRTFVAWNWLASNTSGSSNTNGSITSTVSANATAGFSIVSYTGTGSAATVGHGLGVAPQMMIIKNRDNASEQWHVYHEGIGNGYVVWLNSTAAKYGSYSDFWNSTSPTSTVFTVGTANGTNKSGDDLIAYCFAEVEGYSKIGSYTGNGSTDGVFIHTGFKVGWWLVKRTDGTEAWYIRDTTRESFNAMADALNPNSVDAEGSYGSFDFLSNGIKIRESGTGSNTSGATYIYAAFAENPFGGAGVSPATAR